MNHTCSQYSGHFKQAFGEFNKFNMKDHECKNCFIIMTLKIGFYCLLLKVDIFSMKIYIVVTDVVNDVTYSGKSVNTRAHNISTI